MRDEFNAGVIMGGLLYQASTWWGFMRALLVPIFLHTIYDYPILLAHQGLFDTDILYIYLLLLLYLVQACDHGAHPVHPHPH